MAIASQAQKPLTSGYLGKTMYVKYRVATGITLSNPVKAKSAAELRTSNTSELIASLKREFFGISFGKVFSNHIALEVNIGSHAMSMAYPVDYGSYYSDRTFIGISGYPKIKDVHGGLQIKLYSRKRGAIAPVGFYNAFQLNLHNYTINMDGLEAREYFVNNSQYVNTPLDGQIDKYTGYDFNWALGMNRCIGENILIDVGVSTGFSLGLSESDSPFDEVQERNRENLRHMLVRYYLNKVYFGIGYLF